jgi:hypothetical protein
MKVFKFPFSSKIEDRISNIEDQRSKIEDRRNNSSLNSNKILSLNINLANIELSATKIS